MECNYYYLIKVNTLIGYVYLMIFLFNKFNKLFVAWCQNVALIFINWPIIQVYTFITISFKYHNKMISTCEITWLKFTYLLFHILVYFFTF
jgi:hypothetical protein